MRSLLMMALVSVCLVEVVRPAEASVASVKVAVAAAVYRARINAEPELPNSFEKDKQQTGESGTSPAEPVEVVEAVSIEPDPANSAPGPVPLTLMLDPAAADQIRPEPGKLQWLVFTMPACPPCVRDQNDFVAWLNASGEWVGSDIDSKIRLVDVYQFPDLQSKFAVSSVPEYILVQGDRVIERHNRYPGRDHLANRFLEVSRSLPPQAPAGAVTLGSIDGGKAAAKSAIDWMTEMVGESGTFEGTWTRGKGASTTITVADGVSVMIPNPLGIRYDVLRANQSVRIAFTKGRPALRMKVLGILPAQQSVSAIKLDTSEIVLELPGMIDPRLTLR